MNNLVLRSITGLVFVSVLVFATIYSQYSFFVLFAIISSLSLWEFYGITASDSIQPNKVGGIVLNIVVQVVGFLHASGIVPFSMLSVVIPIVLLLFILELYRKKELPFNGLSFTILGVLYVSLPFCLVYYIAMPSGLGGVFSPELVVALLVLVWTNDTGAYLSGMTLGKTKLFERVSPKKTWEGAIGGTVLVLIVSYFISLQISFLSLYSWLIIGFLISVFANFGDLVESLLKRSIGVKDSGKLLPGHGGMLDRFDGVIFAIPAFFSYLQLVNL